MNWYFLLFALVWIPVSVTAAVYGGRHWYFIFCLTPGFLIFNGVLLAAERAKKEWLTWGALAATMIGDYFLVCKSYGRNDIGFLGGVAGFSLAQIFFITYFASCRGFSPKILCAALAAALAALIPAWQTIPLHTAVSLVVYGVLSAISLSGAVRACTFWFPAGVGLLFLSDITIALNWIITPDINPVTSITYLSSLFCFAAGTATAAKKLHAPAE